MAKYQINLHELTGKQFGRLIILTAYRNNKGRIRVKARCACGNIKDYDYYSVRIGHTTSCGCNRKELVSQRKMIHHGRGTRLYNIWKNMRQRCNNPNHPEYQYYGGAGVHICIKSN